MSSYTFELAAREYHEWLIDFVDDGSGGLYNNYGYLMEALDNTPFIWHNSLDRSREVDGLEMRLRYTNEYYTDICRILEGKPCSILEALVALFIRYSEEILCEPGESGYTSELFYGFLCSFSLLELDDSRFSVEKYEEIIEEFTSGRHGIFEKSVGKCGNDMFLQVGKYAARQFFE